MLRRCHTAGAGSSLTLSAQQVKECEILPGVTAWLCACREMLAGWLRPPRALSLLEPPLPPCSQGFSSCRDPLWEAKSPRVETPQTTRFSSGFVVGTVLGWDHS